MAETAQPSPINWPLLKIGVVILVTAILGTFAAERFKHAGAWLPTMPYSIGAWDSVDTPIASDVLRGLGNPQTNAKTYNNPLGEHVFASVMAVGPFENYHDPMVCVAGGGNFFLTAKKIFPLDGPNSGSIRAMIFKRRDGDIRMLMYYWQQNRDGTTDTAARMGSYSDMLARFDTGYGAVIMGHQTCLMRIYAFINPDDEKGAQAQRNVEEVSRAIYHSLRQDAGLETKQ
jgi:hypothetical protein